jgi:hypothetical protein
MYVKEHGELPSFFPSPLSGAEKQLKFLFEKNWTWRYVKEIGNGQWALNHEGESVLRGMEPNAPESDWYHLGRASGAGYHWRHISKTSPRKQD